MQLIFIYSNKKNERFIEQLANSRKFCISCGDLCDDCRIPYGSYASDIIGVTRLPDKLPDFIEEPEEFLPKFFPITNRNEDENERILIGLQVHPDVLMALPDFCVENQIKAVIIPAESGDWLPLGLENQLKEEFLLKGIECAFPRPFCALDETVINFSSDNHSSERQQCDLSLIRRFMAEYKIGRPLLRLFTLDGGIASGSVVRSSPCGCAWYVYRELVRKSPRVPNNNLEKQYGHTKNSEIDNVKEITTLNGIISKAHHSYPCNASMNVDVVLDDMPLHIAGYIHREAVYDALGCLKLVKKENKMYDIRDIRESQIENGE